MKVLVLDCGYNGLAVIQSLGRKGVELYAVDQKRTVGTFSKYVKEYIKIDLNINEKKVIQTLVHKFKFWEELTDEEEELVNTIKNKFESIEEKFKEESNHFQCHQNL